MELGGGLIQEQKQVLSLRQIESLKILTMGAQELHDFMLKEQEENPLVEPSINEPIRAIRYDTEEDDSIMNIPAPDSETAEDIVLSQIDFKKYSEEEGESFRFIASSLDSSGFLTVGLKDLSEMAGLSEDIFRRCLGVMQNLEPAGVCATSINECLAIQLKASGKEDAILLGIVTHYLREAADGKISYIARAMKCDVARVRRCMSVIRTLNPRPLNGLIEEQTQYVIPDVILTSKNGLWRVELNDKWFERFEINDYYAKLAHETADEDLARYIGQKLRRIRFINDAIERRRVTLLRIGEYIARYQSNFLSRNGALIALAMTAAADELGLHPSTISRAISGKYLQCPNGAYKMGAMFARGITPVSRSSVECNISRDEVKRLIRELVIKEKCDKPLSDNSLVQALRKSGVEISRRAVAKYRDEMGIRGMHDRRHLAPEESANTYV
jgi:RNA polymerase sigma-54 factor